MEASVERCLDAGLGQWGTPSGCVADFCSACGWISDAVTLDVVPHRPQRFEADIGGVLTAEIVEANVQGTMIEQPRHWGWSIDN